MTVNEEDDGDDDDDKEETVILLTELRSQTKRWAGSQTDYLLQKGREGRREA